MVGVDGRSGAGPRRPRRYSLALCAIIAISALECPSAKAQAPDQASAGGFDASKLPRVPGAKEVFASTFTTIFVSPDPLGPTAGEVEKALAALGWQKYSAPNAASAEMPTMRTMTLKKGSQALNVFITIAPAQNNAISVQYSALPLKTDLPFASDAVDIEYSPDRPSLTLISGEKVEKLLDFYREQLARRGWFLWSEKTNAKQTAGGPSGTVHDGGGYAYYVSDQESKEVLTLALQKTGSGKVKVEIRPQPVVALESARKVYLSRDNVAPLVAVAELPRLPGARKTGKAAAERASYSVPGNVPATTAAIKALLASQGWKFYVVPLDEVHTTWLTFIKGQQGLSVHFTISPGANAESTDRTTVEYVADRLQFAPPVPADADDLIFDEHRPYLSLTSSSAPQSLREFYDRNLAANDWAALSDAELAAKWPNAKLDPKPANGDIAYYIRGDSRPIMVVLRARDGGKTQVELKTPSFAEPQAVEADSDMFDLPLPKPHRNAGGSGNGAEREIHAQVPASLDAVLSFYRGALSARGWKEAGQGASAGPDEATVNFTFTDGAATLKLGRQYGVTTVSLVEKITRSKTESAMGGGSVNDMVEQAQQMMREAESQAPVAMKPRDSVGAGGNSVETLQPLAGGDAPIPLPQTAQDVNFAGEDGTLEFTSVSSVKSIAEFFRSNLKHAGWRAKPSVINTPNMVELEFAKAGKDLAITILKMGAGTNVNAHGSGLRGASSKPEESAQANESHAGGAAAPAADDLVAEESGGLPAPKRHTMSEATQTPFRRELSASVPLDLAVVLEFYRRELGARNWKEDAKGAVVAADHATVRYASPEGPAVLRLGRKGNETTVSLAVKNPEAASKAGIRPQAGKARVMFGNILPDESSITFNNRSIKVAGNAGTKAPDGPAFDIAPGKYEYSIKTGGKVQTDEVELRADETWGLMIGPGGVLALQAY